MFRNAVAVVAFSAGIAPGFLGNHALATPVPGTGRNVLTAMPRQIGGPQISIYRFETADECQNAKQYYASQYPADKWNVVCILG
ncbi:hypothetical protein ABH945_007046 [Paraburkholderia sp. GAS333]|uniref:hypothetical protein n=1 Tax=Paraburkholderia sp. GAS333 TaxID=3156279 RepID=UPI003D1D8206